MFSGDMADKGRRQQPGFACEECRRRKARCDRARPTCSLCLESSTVCVVLDRKPQRGPKKGRINAMRSQIATLQRQLSQQLGGYDAEDLAPMPGMSGHASPERDPLDPLFRGVDLDSGDDLLSAGVDLSIASHHIISPTTTTHGLATSLVQTVDTSPLGIGWTDWTTTAGFGSDLGLGGLDMVGRDEEMMETGRTTPAEPAMAIITDHVRADLDQVFFDRVHPVLPIVYRRGYFSWADQINPGPARACLRSAIRTIAAAMSALCFRFCDQFYAETRDLLEGYTVGSKNEIALEYIQAWLLLAHYELLRVGEHQALLTAARAFRLVFMARLHNIDLPSPEDMTPPPMIHQQQASPVDSLESYEPPDLVGFGGEGGSFSAIKERRRTFWLGFQLDRLLCACNDYPLTIYEDMISTRLPAPEANFQGNHYTHTMLLSQAIRRSGKTPSLSPFAECVVLASLYGRCAALNRHTHAPSPRTPSVGTGDFWTQQTGLASAIETRILALAASASPTSGNGDGDALVLFAQMLAHSAVIKLAAAAATQQGGPSPSASAWGQRTIVEQQQRAAAAAAEIVRLARLMPSLACFKAHPFLPDPLASAAGYLMTSPTGGGRPGTGNTAAVQQLVRVLRNMQGMNSLARDNMTGLMLSNDGATEFVRGSDLESISDLHSRVGTASTA